MSALNQNLPQRGRWQAEPDGGGLSQESRDSGCALPRAFSFAPLHRFAVPLPRWGRLLSGEMLEAAK
jgi:hypothetical protein